MSHGGVLPHSGFAAAISCYHTNVITLDTPASQLTRYGKTAAARLKDLGLRTAGDLLRYYPLRHDDLRTVVAIRTVQAGERVTLRGKIELIRTRRSFRRGLAITEALLRDRSGALGLTWFNQPYVGKILTPGDEVVVAGRAEEGPYPLHLSNPTYEKLAGGDLTHVGRLVPVYAATHDVSQKQLRALLRLVLPLAPHLPDPLPNELRRAHRLIPLEAALRGIHFPRTDHELALARRRLAFEELFLLLLQLANARALVQTAPAPVIPFNLATVRAFVDGLPFRLTDDQRRAAWEILKDLERPQPMQRLLEGDVGSGKTVVAAVAMVNAAAAGFQSCLMAPTEVLAAQHAATLHPVLEPLGVTVGLLTGSSASQAGRATTRRRLLTAVARGEVPVLVGTHALLTPDVRFHRLGLAVVDEQHRFGVTQRQRLRSAASASDGSLPHLLSLTATPIPRTLALTIYGDLDLSFLKQRPGNRPPVATERLAPTGRDRAYAAIRAVVAEGHQAFILCPLVEESDRLGVRAATEEHQRLTTSVFADLRVGLLHGRLPGKKKIAVLEQFRSGAVDILVATPVVEVGVDVPNATLMLIEGAERFGLSQLHQLRGRVGRGRHPGRCFLLAETDTLRVRQRLDALVASHDGFALAELDLSLRGPGELAGISQSGFFDLRLAALNDVDLIKEVRMAITTLRAHDPWLQNHPALRAALARPASHPE